MYKLELNNETFHFVKRILESAKLGVLPRTTHSDRVVAGDLISQMIVLQINATEAEVEERKAGRYAMNLHSMPEGA